jgi:hypothetical protein
MPRPECSPEENVLRAILTAHRDEHKDSWSSSLFKGRETSVSRLSILGLAELFAVFHQELDSPPKRHVIGAGEINIGRLQEIGRSYEHKRTQLSVEEDPTVTNPAHALIPQYISRGLAFEIIRELIIHRDPLVP